MKYVSNINILFILIRDRLLFSIPFIIINELSNGKKLHKCVKKLPNISLGKYIVLVNTTSCTIILDIPEDAFSEKILPIIIPRDINNIEIITDINNAYIIDIEKLRPSIIANINNSIVSITTIGIKDRIVL